MIDVAEGRLPKTREASQALYLTPYPPMRTGIADYARCFQEALEAFGGWHLRVPSEERLEGNSFRDFMRIRQRVLRWRTQGTLADISLVHAEIGYKQHDEFYTVWWLQRLMPRLPVVVTVHDPPLVVAPALYPLSLGAERPPIRRALRLLDYTPVGRAMVRSCLRGAARLFPLTEQGGQALRQVVPGHPGIQTLPHINFRCERPLRAAGCESARPVTLLYLGFWGPTKGIETLLSAVERLVAQQIGPIQLLLGGGLEQNGANRAYVEQVCARIESSPARAAIQLLGYVPDEDLDATFDSVDIFVVPYTRATGLSASGTVSRAMAAGLAVVASDLGTLRDEICPEETGLLTPPGDAAALANALTRLCQDPDLRRQLGQSAQEHLFAEHSRENVARKVKIAYDSICYNPASR